MVKQLLCFDTCIKWIPATLSSYEVEAEQTCVDDEGVESEKEGDGGPSVVAAPVEIDEGEQVAAHIAARQQGVEHPEGENLQHHSCHRFSQVFELIYSPAATLGHTSFSCDTLDTETHYLSFTAGK